MRLDDVYEGYGLSSLPHYGEIGPENPSKERIEEHTRARVYRHYFDLFAAWADKGTFKLLNDGTYENKMISPNDCRVFDIQSFAADPGEYQ